MQSIFDLSTPRGCLSAVLATIVGLTCVAEIGECYGAHTAESVLAAEEDIIENDEVKTPRASAFSTLPLLFGANATSRAATPAADTHCAGGGVCPAAETCCDDGRGGTGCCPGQYPICGHDGYCYGSAAQHALKTAMDAHGAAETEGAKDAGKTGKGWSVWETIFIVCLSNLVVTFTDR